MELKTGIAWTLIIMSVAVAVCLVFNTFNKKPGVQEVASAELVYIGEDKDGEHWYIVFKAEAKDWVVIVSPLLPTILILAGLGVNKIRKKNGNNR